MKSKLRVEDYQAIVRTHKGILMDGFFVIKADILAIFDKPLKMEYYKPERTMHAFTAVFERENLINMSTYHEIIVALQLPYSKN